MREKPEKISDVAWKAFNKWADDNDVGDHIDDWTPWYECWMHGNAFGYGAGLASMLAKVIK